MDFNAVFPPPPAVVPKLKEAFDCPPSRVWRNLPRYLRYLRSSFPFEMALMHIPKAFQTLFHTTQIPLCQKVTNLQTPGQHCTRKPQKCSV